VAGLVLFLAGPAHLRLLAFPIASLQSDCVSLAVAGVGRGSGHARTCRGPGAA
jgi:hypothetical protein